MPAFETPAHFSQVFGASGGPATATPATIVTAPAIESPSHFLKSFFFSTFFLLTRVQNDDERVALLIARIFKKKKNARFRRFRFLPGREAHRRGTQFNQSVRRRWAPTQSPKQQSVVVRIHQFNIQRHSFVTNSFNQTVSQSSYIHYGLRVLQVACQLGKKVCERTYAPNATTCSRKLDDPVAKWWIQ